MSIYGKYINRFSNNNNIEDLYESIIKETSDNIILFESLDIINESTSILLEVNIKEKISSIWEKFIKFIKEIFEKIKRFFSRHPFTGTEDMLDRAIPKVDSFSYNLQTLNIEILDKKYVADIDKDLSNKMKNISDVIISSSKKVLEYKLEKDLSGEIDKFFKSFNQSLFGKKKEDMKFTDEIESEKTKIEDLINRRIEDYDEMDDQVDSINKSLSDYNITEKEVQVDTQTFINDSKDFIKSFSSFAEENKRNELVFGAYITEIEQEKDRIDHLLSNFDSIKISKYPLMISKYISLAAKIYRAICNYSEFSIKIFDMGDFEIRRNLKKYCKV